MIISYRDKPYVLPDPLPTAGQCLMRVERYAVLPRTVNEPRHDSSYPHRLSKALFFLMREGASLTVRKYRAAVEANRVHNEKDIVVSIGRVLPNNEFCIAISAQYCPNSDTYVVPCTLCLRCPGEEDIEKVWQAARGFFARNVSQYQSLFAYSEYSGNDIGFSVQDILLNAELGSSASPSFFACANKPPTLSLGVDRARNDTSPTRNGTAPSPLTKTQPTKRRDNKHNLFLVGSGSYARSYILPALRTLRKHSVVDLNPLIAARIQQQYKFQYADTCFERAVNRLVDMHVPVLVIASYHSTHTDIATKAIEVNPSTRILIEKPPAVTAEQALKLIHMRDRGAHIEIGYNRRHSKLIQEAKEIIAKDSGPITITCIVKELSIPSTHWYYWPTQGTRITGNIVHWIDLGVYFIEAKPSRLTIAGAEHAKPGDECCITCDFEDGSRIVVVATDRGNALRGVQEYIEIRRDDTTVSIHDFLKLVIQRGGERRVKRWVKRDKGHTRLYRNFLASLDRDDAPTYPQSDLATTSLLCISAVHAALGKKHATCLAGRSLADFRLCN